MFWEVQCVENGWSLIAQCCCLFGWMTQKTSSSPAVCCWLKHPAVDLRSLYAAWPLFSHPHKLLLSSYGRCCGWMKITLPARLIFMYSCQNAENYLFCELCDSYGNIATPTSYITCKPSKAAHLWLWEVSEVPQRSARNLILDNCVSLCLEKLVWDLAGVRGACSLWLNLCLFWEFLALFLGVWREDTSISKHIHFLGFYSVYFAFLFLESWFCKWYQRHS